MTANQETSLRERIEREADAHDYFAANPDLRMTTGDHAARAKNLRAIAEALAARAEPQAGEVALLEEYGRGYDAGFEIGDRLANADLDAMVDRFPAWKLPADFRPDAGITFAPNPAFQSPGNPNWPVGTNLLTAEQARAMFAHCAAPSPASRARPEAQGEECRWPKGARFAVQDEPGEHDPCWLILPSGEMLAFNHYAINGVDQARAHFIANACNAALFGHRPSDDELWEQTLRERDRYHDVADNLANGIARHLGCEIGEHSSMNDPWQNALDAIEDAQPYTSAPARPVGR